MKNMIIKWFWNKKVRKTKQFYDYEGIKSILFLKQNESREELLKNTALFREIKKVYPEIKIGVVISKDTEEFLKNNPHIDNIYIYNRDKIRDIKSLADKIKKAQYDIVMEERVLSHTLGRLGIEKEMADLTCDVYIADHNLYRAQAFKSFLKDKKMIVVYEKEIHEELLGEVKKLLESENNSVIFLFPEEKRKDIKEKLKEIAGNKMLPMVDGLQDILALINIADELMSSDPLLKEIAAAGRKNCLER